MKKEFISQALEDNRPFLVSVARKYKKVMDPEDLVQEVSVRLWNFMNSLGPSTAQAIDTQSFKRLSMAFVRNVALNETRQEKFERSFVHNDILPLSEVNVEPADVMIYIDYINKNCSGQTKMIFNILVNVFFNKLNLKKKDVCEILGIDASTLSYHLDKIKQLTKKFNSSKTTSDSQ